MPRAITQVDQLIDHLLDPQPVGEGGGNSSPALATAWSSEADAEAVWTVRG
jgi:hypothetical protein